MAIATYIQGLELETARCLRAYREGGDERARERLVELHLPLVAALARRYRDRGEPVEDLEQAGAVGLLAAIERFDPDRGRDLRAFAVPTVDGEIRRHLRDRATPVRAPRRIHELRAALPALDRELAHRLGRRPTPDELARAAGARPEDVLAASEPLVVPLDESTSPSESDGLDAAEDRVALGRALAVLDRRERRIVALRFAAGLSQARIGARLGISQVHVSRLLRHALETLRRELDDQPGPA
ncbi:MAG TPA: sigma-70 family RNA polymerase sigma factor [Gaiellaceae bacterium]|nr:sigma-70 family RNA polymerase sigma factor [Gaiellaceae bacterium]